MDDVQKETEAMSQVHQAVAALDVETAKRVLAWAIKKVETRTPPAAGFGQVG